MLQPSQDKSKLLYDAVSKDYSIGTYDEFKKKLESPEKRKAFYDGVGSEYSLGTYEEFDSKIGSLKKKEPSQQGSQPISPEKVWGSSSQPKSAYDTLVTDQAKQVGVSVTSAGKPKPKPKADGAEWTGGAGSFTIGVNQEYKNRADNYIKSTRPQQSDIDKAKQDVDSEWNNQGIWNNVKRYAGSAAKIASSIGSLTSIAEGITGGISKMMSDAPGSEFEYEKKMAKKQLLLESEQAKKDGGTPPIIDNTTIAQRTKANLLEKKINSITESKERDYLIKAERNIDASGLSEKDKIERFDTQKVNTLKHIDRVELQKQNILRPAIEESIKDLNQSILKANNFVKAKSQVPPELLEEINQKQQELKLKEKITQDSYNKFLSNRKELGTFEHNLDVVKRDYNWGKNLVNTFGATTIELMSGMAAIPGYSANIVENIVGKNVVTEAFKKQSKWESELYGKEAEELRNEIAKPISIEDIDLTDLSRGVSDFGDWFRNTFVASQAPILGATLAGGAGFAAIGSASAGNAYTAMQKEVEAGTAEYTPWQLAAIPAAHGGIDSVQAIVESNLLKGAGRTLASASVAQRELIAEGMFKPIATKLIKAIPHSNAWFAGITMSKNILTKYGEGKEDVQLTDGLADSIAMATAMGGMLPVFSHVISEKIVKPFRLDNKISKLSDSILVLENELKDTSIDPIIRTEKESLLDNKRKAISTLLVKQVKDIKSLSNEQFTEVLDINKEQSKLRDRAAKAKEAADPSDTKSTQDILDNLAGEFKVLEQRRVKILQKGPSILLEQLNNPEYVTELKTAAENKLVKEAKDKGKTEVKFTDDEISREAITMHNEKIAIKKGYEDYNKRVAEQGIKPAEEKVWYYNEDAKRGPIESAPETLPEGYTSAKKIENSVELERWKNQTEVTTETITKEKEVEQLREQERLEKEKVDPNDKEKLDEIYDKYDKLISPLLREIEGAKAEVTPTEKTQGTLDVISEPIDLEVPKPKVEDVTNKTDVELEDRYQELDEKGFKEFTDKERDEFNAIEKEQQKREWKSIVDAPINKVKDILIDLKNKLKEGKGVFVEKWEVNAATKAVDRYSNPSKLTDKEILKDFSDALKEDPTKRVDSAILFRESFNEASKRGLTMEDLLKEPIERFTRDGYSEETAREIVSKYLEPVLKGAKEEVPKPKVEAPKEEVKTEEELTAFGLPIVKENYYSENPKIIENRDDAIEIEKITKDIYRDRISYLDIRKEGNKWVVRTETEGNELFSAKTLKEAKEYIANYNLDTEVVRFKEKPKEEAKVAEVVEPKTAEVVEPKKVDTSKIDEEIDFYQRDVDYSTSKIDDIQNEIISEKGNTKSGLIELREQVKKEIEEVKKDKSLSKDERLDKIEEIKYQIENFKEEQQDLIESYKDDLQAEKADLKKSQKKLDKFIEQKKALLEQETAPVETKKEQLTKEVDDATKALKDAYNAFKTVGFALDPKQKAAQDLKNQAALNKALIDYGVAKLKKGTYDFSEFVKDLAEEGVKISKEFAKDVYDKFQSVHKAQSKERLGIEVTPKEKQSIQAKIDKAYKLGVKEQKAISKEIEKAIRLEKKEAETQARDVLAAQKKVLGIEKTEALSKQGEKFKEIVKDLSDQVRDVFKAGVEALKVYGRNEKERFAKIKQIKKDISAHISENAKKGNFTATQTESLLKKINNLNVENPEHVSKFKTYIEKVFENKDYAKKLSDANKTLKSVKKLSLDKTKDPMLRELAKQFSKIDPLKVEDIDAYNNIASKIQQSLAGSKVITKGIKVAEIVDVKSTMEYVDKELAKQIKDSEQSKRDQFYEMTGIDSSEFTYQEVKDIVDGKKEVDLSKEKESVVREGIKKAFNSFKAVVDYSVSNKTDAFTGEEIQMSKKDAETLSNFTSIDTDYLSVKDALKAIDSVNNYLVNGSMANMEGVFNKYNGMKSAEALLKDNVVAKPIRMYFSKKFGRIFYGEIANIDALVTRAFKGFSKSGKFLNASKIMDFVNGKADAVAKSNKYIETYLDKYKDSKPNGKEFNDEVNIVERGMFAFLKRNSMESTSQNKTPEVAAQSKAEFNRRKKIIEDSIDALAAGDKKEIALGELYKSVYDKLFSNGDSIEGVEKSTDKKNVEATNYWTKEIWDNNFDEMQSVSQGVRGETLVKEAYYNPDVYVSLSYGREKNITESLEDSSIHNEFNSGVYDKKSGSFNKVIRQEGLPKNSSGNNKSYINLSFDSNNARWLNRTMIDMKTAATTKHIAGFLDSKGYEKIIPSAEDRNLISKRIIEYVSISRGASKFDQSELNDFNQLLNTGSRVGATIALGGISQGIMQTIPVYINTAINANLKAGLKVPFGDKGFHNFIDNSGYAISNRGMSANLGAESLNKIMEVTYSKNKAKTFLNKRLKNVGTAQEFWLKTFLEKPDVYIARASWGTYYEQKLGYKVKDWDSHKMDKDAADYAQRQVDRQQNISDPDLRGSFFTSEDPLRKIITKTTLPFTGFVLNQQARLSNDLAVMRDKSASVQDKILARKSYAAGVTELSAFSALKIAKGMLIHSAAAAIMGVVLSEEEEEEYMNKLYENSVKNVTTDLISPISLSNNAVLSGADYVSKNLADVIGGPEYVKGKGLFGLDLSPTPSRGTLDYFGSAGIPVKAGIELWDYLNLASKGTYMKNGEKWYISNEAQNVLLQYAPFAIGGATGVLPNEGNLIQRDLVKMAKNMPLSREQINQIKNEFKQRNK